MKGTKTIDKHFLKVSIKVLGRLIVSMIFALFQVACALSGSSSSASKDKPLVKECVLPADQTKTLTGKWGYDPIPIAFHQGDWSAEEIKSMTDAIDSWNKFFTASKSKNIFTYGSSSAPTTSTAINPTSVGPICSGTWLVSVNDKKFVGNVVVYKLSKWPASYAASAMALTTFCTTAGKPFPNMYVAIMEVNYQNFFVEGTRAPDLQSIVLHELGHLLGLGHSCEGNKSGYPNCSDPNVNPDYLTASLFPTFGWTATGEGEQRRELGANDQGRSNCLY